MEVKRLHQGDEELTAEILETFFLETHHGDYTSTFLANPLNYLLVAIWENIPVGVLLGYELQRPETPRPMFFLYEMEVLEAQRGRGIGKALIDGFKELCRARQGREIFLVTHRSNIPAMRLYSSTGGVQEGEDNVLFVYENFED
ncbi:MAG: GNAT family N-acetyltransferase [Chloroflexota bacterium]